MLFRLADDTPSLFDQLCDHLVAGSWPIVPRRDEGSVRWRFEGVNGAWNCLAVVREHDRRVLVYSVWKPEGDIDRMTLMAYVTRANWLLPEGAFEMDADSGEVRFRTALAVTGEVIPALAVERLLMDNVITFDRYLPGLQAVVAGSDAVAALAMAEGAA